MGMLEVHNNKNIFAKNKEKKNSIVLYILYIRREILHTAKDTLNTSNELPKSELSFESV